MPFDSKAYGPDVAALLALDGDGQRLVPLTRTACSCPPARERLQAAPVKSWLPGARDSAAAVAGLYLYFSCWEEAHTAAQDVSSAEGNFWHGIVHRQEPDAGNAGYWFRRVGAHPVFPALHAAAAGIVDQHGLGMTLGAAWDPFAFVNWCEQARRQPGSPLAAAALEIQRAEWQLLFDYCARPPR